MLEGGPSWDSKSKIEASLGTGSGLSTSQSDDQGVPIFGLRFES